MPDGNLQRLQSLVYPATIALDTTEINVDGIMRPLLSRMAVSVEIVERPAIPNTRELVSLKIDSDVLAHFQADGPGWQERINDTLRAAMNVSS